MKTRILLIERSPIIASGFANLLQSGTTFEVVAVADSLDRIAERIIVAKPDVIVVNPSLIDNSKRQSFRVIFQEQPSTPIVALVSAYFDSQWLKNFNGIIEINDDIGKIENTLNHVLQTTSGHTESAELYELSDREREVLIELSKGQTSKEIAEKLHISVHTVITHRKNIVRKTGIKSAAGLAVYAMLNNLIEP